MFTAAISDRGQVVGSRDFTPSDDVLAYSTPVLWRNGRTTVLPTLFGSRDGGAVDINGQDQIIGNSATKTGKHAVLWTLRRGT
jgi:uncharacterized membrane protein